jgi:hypothetical protein
MYTVQNIENYGTYDDDEKDETGIAVNIRQQKNSNFLLCVKLGVGSGSTSTLNLPT